MSDDKERLIELLQEKNRLLEDNRVLDEKRIELLREIRSAQANTIESLKASVDALKKNLAAAEHALDLSERAVAVQAETITSMTAILRMRGITIPSDTPTN